MMWDTSKKIIKRVVTRRIALTLQCVMTSFYETFTMTSLISFEASVSSPTLQNLLKMLVYNFLTFSKYGVTKQIVLRKIYMLLLLPFKFS